MRRILLSGTSALLLALVFFPPMRVAVKYVGETEYSIAFRPVWAVREWNVGQVAYHAEIHTSLFLALGVGIICVAVLAWVFIGDHS